MRKIVSRALSVALFALTTIVPAAHADNYKGSKAYVCPESGKVFHADKKCSALKGCSAMLLETKAKLARQQGYTLCDVCSKAIADEAAAKEQQKKEQKEKKAQKKQEQKEKKAKKKQEQKEKKAKKQQEKAAKEAKKQEKLQKDAQKRVDKAQRELEKAQKAQQKL
ncbi:MAG: hypothetical protein IJ659_07120 [Alloprevotella sp.]|nr:hypothetical protein [Alloprevotella sp.]